MKGSGWGLEQSGYTFYSTDGAAVGIPSVSSVYEVLPPAGKTVTATMVSHTLTGATEIVSSDGAPTLTLDQVESIGSILSGSYNVADTAGEIEHEIATNLSVATSVRTEVDLGVHADRTWLAPLDDGNFAVLWSDGEDVSPSNGSVYLRVIDKDGGEVAADLLIAGPAISKPAA